MAVLLLVSAVFLWFRLSERSDERAGVAAGECVEGPATLDVTVDPEIAAPVRAIADRYNATEPKVRDHCAKVVVTDRPSADIAAALAANGPWDPALGPQPGLWIPDSTRSIESVRVPGLIEGQPESIASSPIVLAVPDQLRGALESAQVSWVDLPRLQQGSLDEIGLSGWGGLKLALPVGDSSLAVAAAIAGSVSGTDPLTAEGAASGQAVAAVSGVATHAPESTDIPAALAALSASDPAAASIHAVPVTVRQLDTAGGATAFVPAGTAPIADYPAALMAGPWVDKTQNLIAGLFAQFLRKPESLQEFTTAGFAPPPPNPVPVPPRAALDKLSTTLAHPVLGVNATVLVDVSASMSTDEGSSTRMTNTVGALASTVNVMPPDFGLGVWKFGKNLSGGDSYQVAAQTAPLSDAHRGEVMDAVGSVRAGSTEADECYPALVAAYRAAVSDYRDGYTNSILLITDGPEDDSELTDDELLSEITDIGSSDTPVRIDVLVVGGAGADALRTLTERTGGTYTVLPSSNDLQFGTAVVQALTTP